MTSEEKKPTRKEEYIDVEQLYKLAAQSGSSINFNFISDSEVTIHSEHHVQINIGAVIKDVENLNVSVERKTEIVQCINQIKEQVESKAPWEKVVERITVLLGFGKEALPVVAGLVKWLMENLPHS